MVNHSNSNEKFYPLRGIYPILATCFDPNDEIDYKSQKSLIEFCIDKGVHGLVMLANASEGHLLSEQEKRDLIEFCMKEIDGRIPVVITVNHPSAKIASEMAKYAESKGATAVMCLPPFFGRWRSSLDEIFQYFSIIDEAVTLPIIIQDHALTDISMPIPFLYDLAKKLKNVRYVKLESGNIIHKARKLNELENSPFHGIFGGNSGVFMPEEVEVGCIGTMPACYMPDVFRKTWDMLECGEKKEAVDYFTPFSRLAAYEKDVSNRCIWKEILVQRKVIEHNTVRAPRPGFLDEFQVGQMLGIAKHIGLIPE